MNKEEKETREKRARERATKTDRQTKLSAQCNICNHLPNEDYSIYGAANSKYS